MFAMFPQCTWIDISESCNKQKILSNDACMRYAWGVQFWKNLKQVQVWCCYPQFHWWCCTYACLKESIGFLTFLGAGCSSDFWLLFVFRTRAMSAWLCFLQMDSWQPVFYRILVGGEGLRRWRYHKSCYPCVVWLWGIFQYMFLIPIVSVSKPRQFKGLPFKSFMKL